MANWCKYCKGSYPKYWCEVTNEYIPWGIVERSCMNNGYKCSNYYVSTAIGFILKLDQKDPVLENVRNLRDEFLEKNEQYSSLLNMYDTVGPVISDKMDEDPNKEETATKIYSILSRISNLSSKDEKDKAVNYYCQMVGALINKYGLTEEYNKSVDTINSIDNPTVKKVKKISKTLE